MSDPSTHFVTINGQPVRVLEKGTGPRVGFLAGLAGVPRWTPFLDELARSNRVVVPSLPGFPGAVGHEELDHLLDWLTVTLDLIEACELSGCDLVGSSVGAMLALELAAMSPASVGRLALLAPLGLHDAREPIPHLWARRSAELPGYLCADTEALATLQAVPVGENAVEWNLSLARATSAGARLLWPMCDLGLEKRLHRVRHSTLLVWGGKDRILGPLYEELFREKLAASAQSVRIPDAGHLIDIDAPANAARLVTDFLATPISQQEDAPPRARKSQGS
jgi:pimeloyl-ACP methyl ester carboxylesterase